MPQWAGSCWYELRYCDPTNENELIDPDTLKTEVRFIQHGSDFHRLARFLETRVDPVVDWSPGRRSEP